jgi:ElaB/YqjD/DUF883 family membrane-anchored ribosome-binding protein
MENIMADSTTYRDEGSSTLDQVSDRVSESADTVREKAQNLGRKAVDRVNDSRSSAASGLENAASAIHGRAENLPGGPRVQSAAHSTADKLAATANYMRTHEVKDVVADIEHIIRRNPGQSLLAACVVGFFAGRLLRHD